MHLALLSLLMMWECASAFRAPPTQTSLPRPPAAAAASRPPAVHPHSRTRPGPATIMTASQTLVTVGGPEGECNVLSPSGLKNTYFAVRHGHAVNNLENLISSSPAVGTKVGINLATCTWAPYWHAFLSWVQCCKCVSDYDVWS
jgi:hypothetical protein